MRTRSRVVAAVMVVVVPLLLAVACSSNGSGPAASSSGSVIPPDLVPASAADAVVTVARPGAVPVTVVPAVVHQVVPFLVRRVFDAAEPLHDYGLDAPVATVVFANGDGSTITLAIGGHDLDDSAYYVQRIGDARIWLVLADSVQPLLAAH